MIRSMTGYGKKQQLVQGHQVSFEIRSLNSKYLELNLRMPPQFREKEYELRNEIGKHVERGKAEIFLNIEANEAQANGVFNEKLIEAYHKELKRIGTKLKISEPIKIDSLLKLPNAIGNDRRQADETLWKQIKKMVDEALIKYDAFRVTEGKSIEKDMKLRVQLIEDKLKAIFPLAQQRTQQIKDRLEKELNKLKAELIDKNRFEQELIFYFEKLDITEEKVRLKSHIQFFRNTLKAEGNNGKKLGFICQEIGREINTIGSKANDADIQKIVVEMKDELEKIKEQVSNTL
ncbi:MAG TPA: YicC family protein [Bacteroidia bacterium]|nr:YicC family protein [Bacteroidia bacterium]HNT80794.1 YicC family protein [Bacteroidia bacterium]